LETKTRALAIALGEGFSLIRTPDPKLQNEHINKQFQRLLNKRNELYSKEGEWMRDFIDLKAYVAAVDICKNNPVQQRKAYNALVLFLQYKFYVDRGLAKWKKTVNDPAFGQLELFKEGDDDVDTDGKE
jgi:hypothetical protein